MEKPIIFVSIDDYNKKSGQGEMRAKLDSDRKTIFTVNIQNGKFEHAGTTYDVYDDIEVQVVRLGTKK